MSTPTMTAPESTPQTPKEYIAKCAAENIKLRPSDLMQRFGINSEEAFDLLGSANLPEQAPRKSPQPDSTALIPVRPFEQRALLMIKRGVPIVPLKPRSKIAFFNNWPDLATTDAAQIKRWGEDYPDANCAPVAKSQLGGVWFLEIDNKSWFVKEIEKQTGQKIPPTFTVQSSPERGHFYFRQTTASIAMGNRQGKDENGKEAWSARVDNRYVVGPLSIHPNGGIYEILRDVPIIEAPDWLVEWCVKNDANSKTGTKSKNENHQAQIPEGQRSNELIRIAGKYLDLGEKPEQVKEKIRELNAERCEPPLSDEELRKTIFVSIDKYALQPDSITKKINAENAFVLPESRPAEVRVEEIETEPINPSETGAEGLDFLFGKALASTRLQNIYLTDFEPYGWPLELALPALVTAASVVVPPAQDLILGGDDMTNLYTALIGDLGVGKSRVVEWATKAIGIYEPPVGQHYFEAKFGSAEQMLKSLYKKQSVFTSKSVLINPDEWAHLFAKATIPDASFPTVLTTSFYRRNQIVTVGGTGGGTEYLLNLQMSFIGGIVEQDSDTVFGANTLGGLYDRFLFGRAPDGFSWNYQPCPIEQKKHWAYWNMKSARVDPSVYEVVKGWAKQNPNLGRVAEICVRIAMIYASLDGRPVVTGKDFEPLKALALYQIGLRQIFKPNPGENPDAVFANKALAWIQKYAGEWTSIAKLKQHTWRVEQALGPGVAVRSLIWLARSGRIEIWLAEDGKQSPSDYMGPRPRIGLVRRIK